jgi:transposase
VLRHDRFGGGSVMMWGGISGNRRTNLVTINGTLNAQRYRTVILTQHVRPFIAANGGIFQQDNARPHVARANRDFLANNNIDVLPWPAFSPDLSPIEHLWDQLDR